MKSLGQTIRHLRKARGLTQRDLAAQVGINFTYLSKVENDRLESGQSPRSETLQRLAAALDADSDELHLLAGRIPESIVQRILDRPDFFRKTAWIDDSTLAKLLHGMDDEKALDAMQALGQANEFLQGVLDALSTHIAVLNDEGVVVAVNRAWSEFATQNQLPEDAAGVGVNYLAVCDTSSGKNSEQANAVAAGLRQILRRKLGHFETEYPCHSPDEKRWFLLRASRFDQNGEVRVVVSHDNITARKLLELAAADQRSAADRSAADD